eukprot:16350530-Heterocapsa_arctica.AAC.1
MKEKLKQEAVLQAKQQAEMMFKDSQVIDLALESQSLDASVLNGLNRLSDPGSSSGAASSSRGRDPQGLSPFERALAGGLQ